MTLTSVQRSILYTLAYSQQFEFPLTVSEIWSRLIRQLDDKTILLSESELAQIKQPEVLKKELQQLVKIGLIENHRQYLTLTGRGISVSVRLRRQEQTPQKHAQISHLVRWISHCPWVKAVFVTGSVAVKNADADDDIDFLIVTSNRRLWLTRILILLFATSRGKRRSWQGEEKRSWCFNLWLTESQLAIFSQNQNLFTAYEIMQAQCVFDQGGVAAAFYQQNQWVTHFLPHFRIEQQTAPKSGYISPFLSSLVWCSRWFSWVWDGLEWIAYRFQLWYMRPHMTRERVSADLAFFHPRDTKAMVTQGWSQALTKLLDRD